MFCRNCGTEFPGGNFCPKCGTATVAPATPAYTPPTPTPAPTPAPAPTPDPAAEQVGDAPKKNKKTGLIIIIATLGVIVAALAATVIFLLMGGDDDNTDTPSSNQGIFTDSNIKDEDAALNAKLSPFFPENSGFESEPLSEEYSETITAIYKEKSGKGYVFEISTNKGYTGRDIEMLAGIDSSGKITKLEITSYPESKGSADEFTELYEGKSMPVTDMIGGATYSSRAIKDALDDAYNVYLSLKGTSTDTPSVSSPSSSVPSASTPSNGCTYHYYNYGICSSCGELSDAAKAVQKYAKASEAIFISSFEESFSSTSGTGCETKVKAVGTGIVVDVRVDGLSGFTEYQKQELQNIYDDQQSTFDLTLSTLQLECPQLEYITFYVRDEYGILLATINAGK